MDQMLVALSKYRKADAASSLEEEYVGKPVETRKRNVGLYLTSTIANMFEAVCSSLMVVQNQNRFMQLEGLELMLRMIKQRKVAYAFAIRTIKYAIGKSTYILRS